MNPTDLSVFVFGIILVAIHGFGFVVIPNTVLGLFKVPQTKEVWIRILGFIIALLGAYYIVAGLYHLTAFAWATVFGRFAVLLFLIVIAALKMTKATIILFGIIDAAGATWTLLTLLAPVY
jgi:hypothetical protein